MCVWSVLSSWASSQTATRSDLCTERSIYDLTAIESVDTFRKVGRKGSPHGYLPAVSIAETVL